MRSTTRARIACSSASRTARRSSAARCGLLVREHQGGLRLAEKLAADLAAHPSSVASRRRRRLLAEFGNTSRTRVIRMRSEAIFYARSERVLGESDWTVCRPGRARDPMGNEQRLAWKYPRLAARLSQPVSEVAGHGDAYAPGQGGAAERARVAARDGIEQLFELYGELVQDAFEVARTNLAGLRTVRSPWDLARAGGSIGTRSCRVCRTLRRRSAAGSVRHFLAVLAALRSGSAAGTGDGMRGEQSRQ
jgi:hypothetical protein